MRSHDIDKGTMGNAEGHKRSYWGQAKAWYNDMVSAIIRPARAQYKLSALGPKKFSFNDLIYVREDFELVNKESLKLVCSHWRLQNDNLQQRPCVLYMHGNAGCRAEAISLLPIVLECGISLLAFDFSGSGMSEGEYISLGWFEREDVDVVVKHLRDSGRVSSIGLWGRSMGAATALMFADRDPSIACLVLDSPFASFRRVARDLVEISEAKISRFAFSIILRFVRSSVKNRANFDVNELSPIDFVESCYVPALFGAAHGDTFVRPDHSQRLHDLYGGDKRIVMFEGDHNTPRPTVFHSAVAAWLHSTMVVPSISTNGSDVSD